MNTALYGRNIYNPRHEPGDTEYYYFASPVGAAQSQQVSPPLGLLDTGAAFPRLTPAVIDITLFQSGLSGLPTSINFFHFYTPVHIFDQFYPFAKACQPSP